MQCCSFYRASICEGGLEQLQHELNIIVDLLIIQKVMAICRGKASGFGVWVCDGVGSGDGCCS